MAETQRLEGIELVHKAAGLLYGKKVEDVVVMDLRGLSTITDYYLICTCQSEAQMRAALQHTAKSFRKAGLKSIRSEYSPGVRWAILDYGELIIHLFEKGTREFYSLERLWADAEITRLNPAEFTAEEAAEEEEADEDEEL